MSALPRFAHDQHEGQRHRAGAEQQTGQTVHLEHRAGKHRRKHHHQRELAEFGGLQPHAERSNREPAGGPVDLHADEEHQHQQNNRDKVKQDRQNPILDFPIIDQRAEEPENAAGTDPAELPEKERCGMIPPDLSPGRIDEEQPGADEAKQRADLDEIDSRRKIRQPRPESAPAAAGIEVVAKFRFHSSPSPKKNGRNRNIPVSADRFTRLTFRS